ncbi:hypothetical protein J6590_098303 [Homalodisca vitripennis]|nr:hypothetical protein J6590_098303 [Homalodisca vitripennis]
MLLSKRLRLRIPTASVKETQDDQHEITIGSEIRRNITPLHPEDEHHGTSETSHQYDDSQGKGESHLLFVAILQSNFHHNISAVLDSRREEITSSAEPSSNMLGVYDSQTMIWSLPMSRCIIKEDKALYLDRFKVGTVICAACV